MKEKTYMRVARYMSEIKLKQQKITNILPEAIKEMESDGYTYNQIAMLLGTGKPTIVKVVRGYRPKNRRKVKSNKKEQSS